jgi:hypothetical protein
MKGVRFYLEFRNQVAKIYGKNHLGCVVAMRTSQWLAPINGNAWFTAVGGEGTAPNGEVTETTRSQYYLEIYCKRISEARAREIHPCLFEYLDNMKEVSGAKV